MRIIVMLSSEAGTILPIIWVSGEDWRSSVLSRHMRKYS